MSVAMGGSRRQTDGATGSDIPGKSQPRGSEGRQPSRDQPMESGIDSKDGTSVPLTTRRRMDDVLTLW